MTVPVNINWPSQTLKWSWRILLLGIVFDIRRFCLLWTLASADEVFIIHNFKIEADENVSNVAVALPVNYCKTGRSVDELHLNKLLVIIWNYRPKLGWILRPEPKTVLNRGIFFLIQFYFFNKEGFTRL